MKDQLFLREFRFQRNSSLTRAKVFLRAMQVLLFLMLIMRGYNSCSQIAQGLKILDFDASIHFAIFDALKVLLLLRVIFGLLKISDSLIILLKTSYKWHILILIAFGLCFLIRAVIYFTQVISLPQSNGLLNELLYIIDMLMMI